MTATIGSTDGRILRGARTRSSIVQALLDLLNDGELSPTAAQIADRAGVSVRSVFQHFSDMEALYADLAAEQGERVAPLLESLERPAGLPERIDALVRQRSHLYETITPVRHAIGTRAFESASVAARLQELSAELRSQVRSQFSDELAARPPQPRAHLLEALDLAASFEAWDRLRIGQGLDVAAAADAVRATLNALLG